MNKLEMKQYTKNCNFPLRDDYEEVAKISKGTFGKVVKTKNRSDPKKLLTLKKVLLKNPREDFLKTLEESRITKLSKPENLGNFQEIFQLKPSQNHFDLLTFEFCNHNLAGLLSNINVIFSLSEIKKVMQQLLSGLYYIHNIKILHRNIKTTNVIITKRGVLKLSDSERCIDETLSTKFANNQLWYQSPELLLGKINYEPPGDLWSVGCIMAEMWTRYPLMPGKTAKQQLTLISLLCGTINPEFWQGVETLEVFKKMNLPVQKRKLIDRLKPYIQDLYACDLLDKLLILDPSKRIDSHSALNHLFFWTDPIPCGLRKMLRDHTLSMVHQDGSEHDI